MEVNRSGYYKWAARKGRLNRYEQDRATLTDLLEQASKAHKSHGYHRLAKTVRNETGWIFSDNLAHKCCKAAGICSAARKKAYNKPGGENVVYENLVKGNWGVTRPLEIVVSDMTNIPYRGKLYEWTLFVDVYNNEIIAHSLSARRGDPLPYYCCLDILKQKVGKKTEQTAPTILHTDQGAVYSSQAFGMAHEQYNIIRSMSRVGTPTDNPVIESLNGWIKDELMIDFGLNSATNLQALLDEYVHYFNHERLAYALGYKSPFQFKTERGF